MTLPEDTAPHQHFDEEHHPRQRASDQGVRYWAGWLYRHLVPAIAIAVAALALNQTQGKIDRQVEGRRIAVDVLCGGLDGVGDAGRAAIDGQLKGLDPRRGNSEAARDYSDRVARAIIAQAGIQNATKVIRQDPRDPKGVPRVDCKALRDAAKATQP